MEQLNAHRDIAERANETAYKFSPAMPRLSGVTADIAYLAPVNERPYNYMYEPPSGTARQNCDYQLRPVWIQDARAMAAPPSVDIDGFELWDAPTSVKDFTDVDAIRTHYYAETIELAKFVTGADHAHIFDHQIRRREAGRPPLTFGRHGDGFQIFLKSDLLGRVAQFDAGQVTQVFSRPIAPAQITMAQAQQEAFEPLAGFALVDHGPIPSTHQVAHGLILLVGHVDSR